MVTTAATGRRGHGVTHDATPPNAHVTRWVHFPRTPGPWAVARNQRTRNVKRFICGATMATIVIHQGATAGELHEGDDHDRGHFGRERSRFRRSQSAQTAGPRSRSRQANAGRGLRHQGLADDTGSATGATRHRRATALSLNRDREPGLLARARHGRPTLRRRPRPCIRTPGYGLIRSPWRPGTGVRRSRARTDRRRRPRLIVGARLPQVGRASVSRHGPHPWPVGHAAVHRRATVEPHLEVRAVSAGAAARRWGGVEKDSHRTIMWAGCLAG